ncbi:hypothetical protein GGQ84_002762 [Desulfitispora alkaliphila]|uniref:hypothetical protein n=1 Tax=Desulfitispora alkaliphila TaxID=622674 RepID=UPI003D1C2369
MSQIETFEGEDLKYNFTGDWERTTQRAYEGNYSFGSKNITHNQQTNAYLTINTDHIEFYWYVSSENNYDWFEFYIDDTREIRASGTNNSWTKFSKELTQGEHTFRWRYVKDRSVSHGDDRAYIDNLIINLGDKRYFIEDEGLLKVWNEDTEKYAPVESFDEQLEETIQLTAKDLSEEVFMEYGMDELVASREGLSDSRPKIHHFTTEEEVVNACSNYVLKLTETVTSLPKIVTENKGRNLQEKIKEIIVEDNVSGTGDLQYALSKDKENWYVIDENNAEWMSVDITDDADFAAKGMRKVDFEDIEEKQYEEIFHPGDELFFAYRFYKEQQSDECKLKAIKINYIVPVNVSI